MPWCFPARKREREPWRAPRSLWKGGRPAGLVAPKTPRRGYTAPAPVPEPSFLALFGAVALAAAGYRGWRRRKQAVPA